MRYVYCMMTACLLCGCQGNTTALRNPFATPNRVPPPATRVLQPGSAQPYYPGDALPGTPAGTVFPPGAVGTPVPAYQPVPGSVPPGGWNTSPQSSVTPTPHIFPSSAALAPGQGPPIQVNVDQQNLRFASTPIQAGPGLWNPPQATPQAMVQTAGFQEPVAQVPQSQFVCSSSGEPHFLKYCPAGSSNPSGKIAKRRFGQWLDERPVARRFSTAGKSIDQSKPARATRPRPAAGSGTSPVGSGPRKCRAVWLRSAVSVAPRAGSILPDDRPMAFALYFCSRGSRSIWRPGTH